MYLRKDINKSLETLEELHALRREISAVLDGIRKRTLCRKASCLMFKFVISGRIRRLVEAFKDKCISGKINRNKPVLTRFFD